jgi:hypothetical protein
MLGRNRDWWIGLTDDNSEGRWFWIESLKEAEFIPWGTRQPDGGKDDGTNFVTMYGDFDYHWTDENTDFVYHGGAFPICQSGV